MRDYDWMKKALVLGLAFFLAVLLVKPVGVSTQYSVFSGIFHSALDSSVIKENPAAESGYESSNAYYDRNGGKIASEIKNPWNYDFVFVVAIAFGAYLGYSINNKRRSHMSNVGENPEERDQSFIRRYLPAFLGGFALLYGARMADGCTSGHMMSGMMQGSISGYIFAAAAFAVAIPAAIITAKISGRR